MAVYSLPVKRDLDGVGPVDDVVVGEDVAVFGDHEAGTGGGAGDGLAEDVGADNIDGDTDAGVDILGVDLCRGQLFRGIHRGRVHLGGRPVAGVDRCLIPAGETGIDGLGQPAQQSTHQAKGHDLDRALLLGRHGLAAAFVFVVVVGILPVHAGAVVPAAGERGVVARRKGIVLESARPVVVVAVVVHGVCLLSICPRGEGPPGCWPCVFSLWPV